MRHLIPQFIYKQHKIQSHQGQFYTPTMFMDISGFTPMTEALMQHGKEGAEILSGILNEVFEPVINLVYYHGGFITNFAGDAFTALFPTLETAEQQPGLTVTRDPTPFQAALSIQQFFIEQGLKQTIAGNFELAVKVGLAIGQVQWGIIGLADHKTYFFQGEGIDACANAEHHAEKGGIILTASFKQWLLSTALPAPHKEILEQLTSINNHFKWHPETKQSAKLTIPTASILTQQKQDLDIATQYYPKNILTSTTRGEFREVVSVFISFTGVEEIKTLNNFVSTILKLLKEFEGYFNHLSFGDKGATMLILFGCPVGHENDLQRAYDFILALKERYPLPQVSANPSSPLKWRAGIAFGSMYAGILGIPQRCEYTTLGTAVNLSARLMMKATWGEAYLPHTLAHHPKFHFKHQGDFYYKGFNTPLATYSLSHRQLVANISQDFYQHIMVGRQAELKHLVQATQPIFKGKFAGITYIYGEAGMGKSRLVYEFKHSLQNVTWFNCQSDSILKQPFNPFVYALKYYFEQDESQPLETRKNTFESKLATLHNKLDELSKTISDTAPEQLTRLQTIKKELTRTHSILGAFVGLHWTNSLYEQLEPKMRYENTLYAIKNLFLAEALLTPVVIEIEDLHWIDSDSLTLLETITRNIKTYPLFIVATSRYEDDGHKPRLLSKQQELDIFGKETPSKTIQEINLNRLSPLDLQQLAELELQGPLAPDLLQFVQNKSQANPFFAQQLIRYIKEQDLIQWQDQEWYLRTEHIELPTTLNALLIARLDRLTQALKETVQTAAVIGRQFKRDILNYVLQALPAHHLKQGIQQQIWLPLTELDYIFKHVLLREAAYQMQLKTRLKKLHHAVAQAIESLYSTTLADYYQDLAYHYQHGEDLTKAKYYLEKAADKAKANFENKLALQSYQQLLDLGLDTDKILTIMLKQAEIYELMGQYDVGISLLEKSIALSISTNNKLKEGELKNFLGEIFWQNGSYNRALVPLKQARDISLLVDDKQLQTKVLNNIGLVYMAKQDYGKSQQYYHRALVISEEIGDKLGIAKPLNNIGLVYRKQGDYNKAHQYNHRSLAICEEIDFKRGIAVNLENIGDIYREKGDYDKAQQYLHRALAIFEEIGNKQGITFPLTGTGIVYLKKKDYVKALQYFHQSLVIYEETGAKGYLGYTYSYLACVYIALGQVKLALEMALLHFKNIQKIEVDVEHGRTHLAVALVIHYQTEHNKAWSTEERELLSNITQLTQLPETATAYFEEAIATASKQNYLRTLIPALYEYGRYLVESGQGDAGLEKLDLAKQKAKKVGRMGDVRKIETIKKELGIV